MLLPPIVSAPPVVQEAALRLPPDPLAKSGGSNCHGLSRGNCLHNRSAIGERKMGWKLLADARGRDAESLARLAQPAAAP